MGSAQTVVVDITGVASVREADDLTERLKHALAAADRIEIDCTGVTEVDLCFIQLVFAAHSSAVANGKSIVVQAGGNRVIGDALATSGINIGTAQSVWFQGRGDQ
jgi:anti-anti-sigma regulatory factor